MSVKTFDLESVNKRMDGAIEALKKELSGVRAGRASTAMLEPVIVEAYGAEMPLAQCATITVSDARLLQVQVWDRGLVKAVEKAIRSANLGLNPQVEGQVMRLPLPEMSRERRQELAKLAQKYAESTRIAIRNVRRDGMDQLKKLEKDSHISQDEQSKHSDDIQKLTDKHIELVGQLLAQKEKDIMQV
ncbi:ribosome recycling factor [Geminicoccus roseus]|jgi:ribosome recycling factor|uniref:ribosome recycling factor n=1 Tax=Geminicoccus roseus TaxID=404900 RepID=UPI0003F821DA|nr:ribosome recycling factor [Geminicoccus roseus]